MAGTVNLTKVDFTSVNENVNLIIEEGHELKRLNLEEAFGAIDNVVVAEDKNNDGNVVLRLFSDGASINEAIEALRQEILGGAW